MIVFLTGAGISADSGIPTFRDADGLWENHKIDEVAEISTWEKNYELVHNFYNQRRQDLKNAEPNAAHKSINDLMTRRTDVKVYTQNIDDLFERAGATVTHLHGDLKKVHCWSCKTSRDLQYEKLETINYFCENCGKTKAKPSVIFFGENAPEYWGFHIFMQNLTRDDVIIICGTSGQVIDLGELLWKNPSYKILNNLEQSYWIDETLFDEVHYGSASEIIPEICKRF